MQYLSFGINALSRTLPKELGNLTELSSLSFSTNNFTGSLPSELGNLVKLQQLWASDTELTGKIPDFIGNWSKLNTLVLRNNNIPDSIPFNIGEYQQLLIPDLLFNLSSLSFLFLGNNKLSGTVPTQKSTSLLNRDLSYNNLEGSFPLWVSEQNLQLYILCCILCSNLVANNFSIDNSNNSVLPLGLNCLQWGFPCNQGTGINSGLAIKCGGPHITASNGIVYERDNETLGPAAYYVINTNRWAVSNVGYSFGTNNAQYTSSSLSQFTNALESELFQTARLSASSLRYYGLELENGTYTVNLQFAKTTFLNSDVWQNLGRCVFDVYIQGNLFLKDFDIRKDAGGLSLVAVQKELKNVQVSQNYLEIHLFWAGKGTCCVTAQSIYGPSISAISATPEFPVTPTVSRGPPSSNKNSTGLIVGLIVGVGVLSFVSISVVFYIVRRRKLLTNDDEGMFMGTLYDGRVVAVKQISVTSHQGKNQFIAEIATISALQHRNLVKLHGCCIEGYKRLLVYEFLENKSLDQALFGNRTLNLNWSARLDIQEVYLIFMRSHGFKFGYLAPEYAMRGHLTEKGDVFAFGIVALEIVSGRPNANSSLEEEKIYLLEWIWTAWQLHENNREIDHVDSTLSKFDEKEVKQLI
ncbi:probable LRR receptor-like serine/threonine-protein kinase At1g56140 [Quercus lobata]|uniref:probable LRR receptor-like serine/threonine-protein kinase At1g56140 n=1 Tax=Quercus lobata TaxID=97700 RepID=UPI0012443744|nr:probable LRR receptor-like serine/threonine-protein kinase At1g56140 [Quercus lobata]